MEESTMSNAGEGRRMGLRYSRRGILRGAGVGLGAAIVGGCTTANPPAPTGAAVGPARTTAASAAGSGAPVVSPTVAARQPKYGGVFRLSSGATEAPHLDPHQTNTSALIAHGAGLAWSQLLQFKNGPGVEMPTFEVAPDLAQSWDQPDDTTYVFKLRPGVKFHNIAPVNGRELVADDVVGSFQRQIDLKVNAAALAGVVRLDAPDKTTLKLTLDKPNADILWSLANAICKVLPRELLGG